MMISVYSSTAFFHHYICCLQNTVLNVKYTNRLTMGTEWSLDHIFTTISFHFRWILCDLPWHGCRHLPPCSRCEVQRSHSGHYKSQLIRSVAWAGGWRQNGSQWLGYKLTTHVARKPSDQRVAEQEISVTLVVLPHLVMLHTSCQPPRPMGSDIGAPIGNAHCCRPNAWGIFVLSPTSFAAFHMNYLNISISWRSQLWIQYWNQCLTLVIVTNNMVKKRFAHRALGSQWHRPKATVTMLESFFTCVPQTGYLALHAWNVTLPLYRYPGLHLVNPNWAPGIHWDSVALQQGHKPGFSKGG